MLISLFIPQLPDQWEKAVVSVSRPGKIPTGSRCGNTVPDDDNQVVSLSPGSRSVQLDGLEGEKEHLKY